MKTHSTTDIKPIELFYESNEDKIEEIRQKRNFKNRKSFSAQEIHLELEKDSKVLIREDIAANNNLVWYVKKNSKLVKSKPNFEIVGTVLSVDSNYVVVKIEFGEPFIKNTIIMIKEEALKVVSEEVYKNFVKAVKNK